MKLPIYLDYAASTPLDKRVLGKMLPFLSEQQGFGNPGASHHYGREAMQAIVEARAQIAALIHAHPVDIIFTSGATEANNLAIKGFAYANQNKGKHIITSAIEHSSVLDTCAQLAEDGFTVTYLQPAHSGLIDLIQLKQALRTDTILVSLMHVNNEIGVIQDIAAIGGVVRESGAFFHVDAVQSAGKSIIDLTQLPVDLMSFSAHKLYGPKGVGALYINQQREVKLQSLFKGGRQEQGLRPGTLATHQIVGMGAAFALAQQEFVADNARIAHLSECLWQGINQVGEVYLNGDAVARAPSILNVAFAGVEAKTLLPALKDMAVATGSACHEGSGASSHVLRGIGLEARLLNSSIRFSLGRFTTQEEINFVVEKICGAVRILRKL